MHLCVNKSYCPEPFYVEKKVEDEKCQSRNPLLFCCLRVPTFFFVQRGSQNRSSVYLFLKPYLLSSSFQQQALILWKTTQYQYQREKMSPGKYANDFLSNKM